MKKKNTERIVNKLFNNKTVAAVVQASIKKNYPYSGHLIFLKDGELTTVCNLIHHYVSSTPEGHRTRMHIKENFIKPRLSYADCVVFVVIKKQHKIIIVHTVTSSEEISRCFHLVHDKNKNVIDIIESKRNMGDYNYCFTENFPCSKLDFPHSNL